MISIRRLHHDDFDEFLILMKSFYSYSGDGDATAPMIRPLFEKAMDSNSNFHVFVASLEDKLMGMISITVGESSYKVSSFAWADDFYVNESCRGKGIGRLLIGAAADFARNQGCSNVLVGVGNKEEESLRFYEKSGFNDMNCKLLTLPLK